MQDFYPLEPTRPLAIHVLTGHFDWEAVEEQIKLNRALVPGAERHGPSHWGVKGRDTNFQELDRQAGDDHAVFLTLGLPFNCSLFGSTPAFAFYLEDIQRLGVVQLRAHDILTVYRACLQRAHGWRMEDGVVSRREDNHGLSVCLQLAKEYSSLSDPGHIMRFALIWNRMFKQVWELHDQHETGLISDSQYVWLLDALERLTIEDATPLFKKVPEKLPVWLSDALETIDWTAPFKLNGPRAGRVAYISPPEILVYGRVPLRLARYYRREGLWSKAYW